MRATILVSLLIAAPVTADAGPYVSLGVGGAPDLGGDFDGMLTSNSSAGRLGIGGRFGPAAIEGGITGFGITATAPTGQSASGTALSAQLSAKLGVPVVLGLGAYARGGIERTWMGPSPSSDDRLIGAGYVAGAGLEYDLPIAGLWLEADREWISIGSRGYLFDGTADSLLAGVRIGI